MAVTSSQTQADGAVRIACGAYIDSGTAAAITISCGFQPRYVKVINKTGLCMEEWIEGMTAAHAVKTVDSGSNATDIVSLTSLGITVSEGGFIIGLDTDINVTSEQLHWVAIG